MYINGEMNPGRIAYIRTMVNTDTWACIKLFYVIIHYVNNITKVV